MARDSEFPGEKSTKYIDTRISVTWLIASALAIISSYILLQAKVGQLSESLMELKQDRKAWIAQNDRILLDLRSISSIDAVQTTRLSMLEAEVQALRKDINERRSVLPR